MNAIDREEFNRRALNPQRSVVIEAAAGSGKTWWLVSRMLRLLLAGVAPGQILAITFTRKAAQEMAARLRTWLLDLTMLSDAQAREFLLARAVSESEVDLLLPKARRLYEESLTAQPPLTVTTFHSWFLQLLKRAPIDASVLGAANLAEQTGPLIDEAWELFASELQSMPRTAAAQGLDFLFSEYGLDNTRRLLLTFLKRRAEWWAYTRHTSSAPAAAEFALQELRTQWKVDPHKDICAALFADLFFVADLRDYAELLARNPNRDQERAALVREALTLSESVACFERMLSAVFTKKGEIIKRSGNRTQALRLGAANEQRLLELHARLAERLSAARSELADQRAYKINEAGLHAGVALLDAYQRLKEGRQVIDFSDIEWQVLELLSTSEHASFLHYKLDARYRHILLDEFQDTNPLQWLILDAWFSAAQEADALPTVFMVGDPKQSIYRFRRAEARLFVLGRDYFARRFHADTDLRCDVSRRCAQAILDMVNQVFAGNAGFSHHTAHYSTKPGRVEVLPLLDKKVAPVAEHDDAAPQLRNSLLTPRAEIEDQRREDEARVIAEKINAIVNHWVIETDAGSAAARLAQCSDILILIRARTHLATYERALRHADIPFVTSGRGGLLDTLEAHDVMALLHFLVSPFSDLHLAQVLRAPIFSCSDGDLITLARAPGETWWSRLQALAVAGTAELTAELARAQRLLSAWVARADTLPVHDQLDRIYFEADLIRRYRAAVPPAMRDTASANLQAFIQRALDTDAGRYPSLPRFIHELEDLATAPQDEAPDEGIIGDPGNAVRILTIHGAKGLEAPIVFLIDSAGAPKKDYGFGAMVDWTPGASAPQHISLWAHSNERSRQQQALADMDEALAAREDANLLYVAMTRAKQALIVTGIRGKGVETSWYARIYAAGANLGTSAAADTPLVIGSDLANLPLSDRRETSELAPKVDARLNAPLAISTRRSVVTTRGERYGSNLHRMLDLLTEHNPQRADLQELLGLGEHDFTILWEQAQHVLNTPKLARFFDRQQFQRAGNEVPFVAQSGELFRLDRLIEFSDEVWVLDYKSGAPQTIEPERMSQYQAQVKTYLDAIRAAFPHRQAYALIVFADGATVSVD